MIHAINPTPLALALAFSLKWEGGYAHHPADRGGPTNYGVTQETYNLYRRKRLDLLRSVRHINQAEVMDLYRERYWKLALCHQMPTSLAVVHFDTAVNFGVTGAAKLLQGVLGVTRDGNIGPITLKAMHAATDDAAEVLHLCEDYCQARLARRRGIVAANPSQKVFLRGWNRRDNALLAYVRKLQL